MWRPSHPGWAPAPVGPCSKAGRPRRWPASRRNGLYSDLADLVFDVDTMTPPQVVEHILAELHERAGAGHA